MPGQRVEMRMVFQKQSRRRNSCPRCACVFESNIDDDVDCTTCGLTFRRFIQLTDPPTDSEAQPQKKGVKDLKEVSVALSSDTEALKSLEPSRPPTTAYDETEDVKYYSRIHVVQQQRRAVWGSQAGLGSKIEGKYPEAGANAHEQLPGPADVGNLSDGNDMEDIEMLGDFVNTGVLEQILEMDDDDEREFSRSIYLNHFEQMESGIRSIQDILNGNSNDV
ncbi:hypothetical protein B0J14DRAFT_585968 [Halenospora varia]|nr:hypothetical protein B0J14DRAFT_585968 [Halenospora varia]